MKASRILSVLSVALVMACSVQAQSVDEIVDKHIAAMGGADKLKGLQTMYTEGVMEVRGMEIPLKQWVVKDKAVRMEFEVMGSNNIQVVTRTDGWMQMPMQGPEPKKMDSNMVRAMQPRLDVTGELFNYKAKGKQVALEGKDTVNGQSAYKLRVTNPDGTNMLLYLDSKTYYIAKMLMHLKLQGQEMDVTTTMTDYRKTPEGVAYAASTAQEPMGSKISVTKVEVNKPVDDTLFTMPKK